MNQSNQPVMNKKQLLKSVLWALIIGAIVLVTAVLPAEYGIDPLGTGKLFGFSRLYIDSTPKDSTESNSIILQTDVELLKLKKLGSPASVPKPVEAENPPPNEQLALRADSIVLNTTGIPAIMILFILIFMERYTRKIHQKRFSMKAIPWRIQTIWQARSQLRSKENTAGISEIIMIETLP